MVFNGQVDLFVNYDCDLQAANLFERTVRGLARTVKAGDPGPGMLHMAGPVVNVNAAQRPRPHVLAADVALAIIHALDAWAEPLKVGLHQIMSGHQKKARRFLSECYPSGGGGRAFHGGC